jgi:hypothetical protein
MLWMAVCKNKQRRKAKEMRLSELLAGLPAVVHRRVEALVRRCCCVLSFVIGRSPSKHDHNPLS